MGSTIRGEDPGKDVHHGDHGTGRRRPSSVVSHSFKSEVVELARTSGKMIAQLCRDLDPDRDGRTGVGAPGRC